MQSNEPIYSRSLIKDSAISTAEAFIKLVNRYPAEERRRFLKACRSRLLQEKGVVEEFMRGKPLTLRGSLDHEP